MKNADNKYFNHFKYQSDLNKTIKNIVIDYTDKILKAYANCKVKNNDVPLELFNKVFCKTSDKETLEHASVLKNCLYVDKDTIGSFQALCDVIANFSNTVLFRSYRNKKGRLISIINHQLGYGGSKNIKSVHSDLATLFGMKNIKNGYYSSVGVAKHSFSRKNISNYAANSSSVLKLDINKFYDSINAKKFIDNKVMFNLVRTSMVGPDFNKLGDYASFSEIYNRNRNIFFKSFDEPVIKLDFNCYPFEKSLISAVDKDVDFDRMHIINYQMLIMILSFVTHNNRIPTGAIYSPALSNLFMLGFDMEMLDYVKDMRDKKIYLKGVRYIDDLTFFIYKNESDFLSSQGISNNADKENNLLNSSFKPFDIAKVVESKLNKYGLYLNYSKTCVQHADSGNITVLGVSVNKSAALPSSKYRKELIDMFRNKDVDITNYRELGKVSYVINLKDFIPDLLMHINYEQKSNDFSQMCNDKNYEYKSFIHDIRESCELPGMSDSGVKLFKRYTYIDNITSRRRFRNFISAMKSLFHSNLVSNIGIVGISNSASNKNGEAGRYIYFKFKFSKRRRNILFTNIFVPNRVLDKFTAIQ